MKEGRDFALVFHINSHFSDLMEDLETIQSPEDFTNSKEKRRAILFDYLQIGELMNQLSKSFMEHFGNNDAAKIVAMRHRIVHGYSTIRDDIIFATLKANLPVFINQLNEFAQEYYRSILKMSLGKTMVVRMNHHLDDGRDKKESTRIGYTDSLFTLEGVCQDIYVLDAKEKDDVIEATVVGVVLHLDDFKDKLIAVINPVAADANDIDAQIRAYENGRRYKLILLSE